MSSLHRLQMLSAVYKNMNIKSIRWLVGCFLYYVQIYFLKGRRVNCPFRATVTPTEEAEATETPEATPTEAAK